MWLFVRGLGAPMGRWAEASTVTTLQSCLGGQGSPQKHLSLWLLSAPHDTPQGGSSQTGPRPAPSAPGHSRCA